ncbi:MAG: glycosyltransferase family 9 protein [Candidatus Zixiibacteriota bacterium]|nr:MAG: glycosyltransferase family 9 protein [candidate division Zixibacteria bacterium]
MNLELIRQLDSKVGTVVCKYLYHYDRFRQIFPPLRRPEGIHRILVIKFWGIGNLVQCSPTLRKIRQLFPEAQVVFLTLAPNKGVYENSGLYDEAIYLHLTTLKDFGRELFRLFFVLRNFQFDLIIDLEPLVHFAEMVSFYAGVGQTVGFSVPGRQSLFTKPIEFREDEHIARTFYRVLEPFGVTGEPSLEELLAEPLPLTPEDLAAADDLLAGEGVGSHEFVVGLNVNASDVAKERRWGLVNFAELADRMVQKLGARVVLFGAPDEVLYVNQAVSMMREDPVNLAGRTSLHEYIAVISRLNLFITNDSGPLHLAYAARVPTISFYGPESPRRYGPLGDLHRPLYKDLDCSPCVFFKTLKKIRCKREAECMRRITVDEVMAHVEDYHRLWAENRRGRGLIANQ